MKSRNKITSSAVTLRLIPIADVSYCAIIGTSLFVKCEKTPDEIQFIPGTFIPDCKLPEEDVQEYYEINHTFKVSKNDESTFSKLNVYKKMRLMVFYTDETGKEIVSGTTEYPLTLSFYPAGAFFICTVKGKTLTPDTSL